MATHGNELARRQQECATRYALRAPRAAGWWTHRTAPTAHSLDDADSKYSDGQNCSEAVHREQRLVSWLAAGVR